MTMKEEADRVATALKAAAESRKAAKMSPRVGNITPSIVAGDKAIKIPVPWVMIQNHSVADISKYIMGLLK